MVLLDLVSENAPTNLDTHTVTDMDMSLDLDLDLVRSEVVIREMAISTAISPETAEAAAADRSLPRGVLTTHKHKMGKILPAIFNMPPTSLLLRFHLQVLRPERTAESGGGSLRG